MSHVIARVLQLRLQILQTFFLQSNDFETEIQNKMMIILHIFMNVIISPVHISQIYIYITVENY